MVVSTGQSFNRSFAAESGIWPARHHLVVHRSWPYVLMLSTPVVGQSYHASHLWMMVDMLHAWTLSSMHQASSVTLIC